MSLALHRAVLPLYFVCGLLGYAAYGDFANANINVNFPDNLANQASIVVQMVQEVRLLRSTRPRRHHPNRTLTPTPHPKPHLNPHLSPFTRSTSCSRPTSSSCSPSSYAWASTQPPAAAPAGMAAHGWGGCPCLRGWDGWCCALHCSARRSSLGLGLIAGSR